MATIQDLGKVAYVSKGTYNNATEYEINDVVTYNGSSYVSLSNHNVGHIPTDTNYWQLIAQKPVKGVDYFTTADKEEIVEEVIADAESEFNQNALEKTEEFNTNATTKTTTFDNNATAKTTTFNNNATSKTTDFNTNASTKTTNFDNHVSGKTTEFDTHASSKVTDYDTNASTKLGDYNTNHTNKLLEYNNNHTAKMNAYDENAQEKIDEYDEHVEELTDRIEYLEDEVNDLSDNQLINSASGSEIYVTDSARARLNEFEMTKESSQETTTGKNLFDGILRLGNYSNETGGYLENDNYIVNTNYIPVNELTNYIFSLNNEGIKMYVFEYREDYSYNLTARKTVYANTNFTTEQGTKYVNFRTFDSNTDLQAKVQLEQGTTITNYEPYTSGEASPSPDYPQEVEVVEGYRNLFDKDNANVIDGYIANGDNYINYYATNHLIYINCESNKTYTIQKNVYSGSGLTIGYTTNIPQIRQQVISRDVFSNTNHGTFTTPANANYIVAFVYNDVDNSSGKTLEEVLSGIQITEGTSKHPYVPHGNNYVDVTVRGKNVLPQNRYIASRIINGITYTNNEDGTFNLVGTATANTTINILSDNVVETGKTYYLYSSVPYNVTNFNMSIPFRQDGILKFLIPGNSITTSGIITDSRLAFYIDNGVSINLTNIKLMLTEDSVATPYEPHQELIVPIPLNGNFIAGIGDYKDILIVDKFGKCYLEKQIGKVILNGTENIDMQQSGEEYQYFKVTISNKAYANNAINIGNYSTHFKSVRNNFDYIRNGTFSITSSGDISLGDTLHNSVSELQTWLQEQYNNDTPVVVDYVLAIEQLIDLHYTIDLKTFKGVNNITNSEEAEMQIKYVQDINTIINKIDDLETRLAVLETN